MRIGNFRDELETKLSASVAMEELRGQGRELSVANEQRMSGTLHPQLSTLNHYGARLTVAAPVPVPR
jgi:hypothetical protein